MTKFIVFKEEVCFQKVEVEADNLYAALQKVKRGKGVDVGNKSVLKTGSIFNWKAGYAVNLNTTYSAKEIFEANED